MGASKSTTKATKTVETSKAVEPSVPEPVKVCEPVSTKAKETSSKLQSKDEFPAPEPVKLPTKSWRSLLNEQSLSADAKPFVPGQALLHKPIPSTPVSIDPPIQDGESPDWMQYLSKKFESNEPAVPTKTKTAFAKAHGKGKGKSVAGGPAADGSQEQGTGGDGKVVIHTEAYLKLLREGSAKKKAPTNNQVAKRTQNNTATGKAGLPGEDDAAWAALEQTDALIPMTTSSLAKKWAGAGVVTQQAGDDAAVQVEEERTTQDDMWVEKLLFDQDLSDPAYFSDVDSGGIKTNSASMHRLGHRPNVGNAMIRTYVMQDLSFELDQAVGMLLLRLQRFMDQQRIFTNCDAISEQRAQQYCLRRFVIGLKEVSRRTKQAKVECLIVAPDIEEDANSGGLDDRMRELLALAYQNHTPVIFALSRARLGKALGKTLHISVLGILDSTGSRCLMQDALKLADIGRQAWLARLGK